jgi:hypothetical protein
MCEHRHKTLTAKVGILKTRLLKKMDRDGVNDRLSKTAIDELDEKFAAIATSSDEFISSDSEFVASPRPPPPKPPIPTRIVLHKPPYHQEALTLPPVAPQMMNPPQMSMQDVIQATATVMLNMFAPVIQAIAHPPKGRPLNCALSALSNPPRPRPPPPPPIPAPMPPLVLPHWDPQPDPLADLAPAKPFYAQPDYPAPDCQPDSQPECYPVDDDKPPEFTEFNQFQRIPDTMDEDLDLIQYYR